MKKLYPFLLALAALVLTTACGDLAGDAPRASANIGPAGHDHEPLGPNGLALYDTHCSHCHGDFKALSTFDGLQNGNLVAASANAIRTQCFYLPALVPPDLAAISDSLATLPPAPKAKAKHKAPAKKKAPFAAPKSA